MGGILSMGIFRLAVGLPNKFGGLSAAGTRMPWHPVPSRAACTYLRYRLLMTCSRRIGAVTCGWLIKLRSAYILCYFIRNRRFALVVSFVFLNAEYRIALVDFIVALRRTKGRRRRTLRSPSPPSSGLHLLTPGKSAAAEHYCCRGFGTILESGIRCRSIIPTSTYRLGALCSG